MDELRELWKKEQGDDTIAQKEVDLSSTTESVVDKMKKALFWEDIFNKLFSIVLFVYLIYTKEYLYGVGFVVFMAPVLWYYNYIITEIEKFTYQTDVKNYLQNIYRILRVFVIRYRAIVVVLVPISFLYGFYVGYQENTEPDKVIEPTTIIIAVIVLLVFYGLAELYIYLLYGRKLEKLKKLLEGVEGE